MQRRGRAVERSTAGARLIHVAGRCVDVPCSFRVQQLDRTRTSDCLGFCTTAWGLCAASNNNSSSACSHSPLTGWDFSARCEVARICTPSFPHTTNQSAPRWVCCWPDIIFLLYRPPSPCRDCPWLAARGTCRMRLTARQPPASPKSMSLPGGAQSKPSIHARGRLLWLLFQVARQQQMAGFGNTRRDSGKRKGKER